MTAALVLTLLLPADERLDRALAKLRQGEATASTDLIGIGASAALPAVIPLLADPNVNVRREAVITLAGWKSAESCEALGTALRDGSYEIRDRAAAGYYHECGRERVPCAALLQGISKGNVSAAAILLCGYCPESKAFLQRPYGGKKMKLEAGGPVVPAALAAGVAKLRLDGSAADIVGAAVKSKVRAETEFVIQVLAEIPARHLALVLPAYDDMRETAVLTMVPSGMRARRICDAVADAMAARLGLEPPAKRGPNGRYTKEELAAARAAAIPRLSPGLIF